MACSVTILFYQTDAASDESELLERAAAITRLEQRHFVLFFPPKTGLTDLGHDIEALLTGHLSPLGPLQRLSA